MVKNIAIGVLAVSVVVLGGLLLTRPYQVVEVKTLGQASQTHTNPEQFLDQVFISRQGDLDGALPGVTTSTGANALNASQVCKNSVVDINLGNINATITLPSSSAMFDGGSGCLTRVGDFRKFFLYNASGTGNFQIAISDQSSTIRLITMSTSSGAGVNGTSSLNLRDVAEITAIRAVSSTSIWLQWIISTFR